MEGLEHNTSVPPVNPNSESTLARLRRRTYGIGIALLVFGGVIALAPKVKSDPKTEKWMIERAPTEFGDYKVVDSYTMDKMVYDTLKPYGIVSRVYGNKDKRFDVVLIASRSKDSFHDPKWCFTAQKWNIDKQEVFPLKSDARGDIKVTMVTMNDGNLARNKLAAFFYRGPDGFYATTNDIKWGMLKSELLAEVFRDKELDGVYYRVIPVYEGATREELLEFINEYLTAAKASSGGYF